MGWAGHVARMGDRRGAYRALVGKPEGKWNRGHGLDWPFSEQGKLAGSCKRGNEPSVSMKCGEFLD